MAKPDALSDDGLEALPVGSLAVVAIQEQYLADATHHDPTRGERFFDHFMQFMGYHVRRGALPRVRDVQYARYVRETPYTCIQLWKRTADDIVCLYQWGRNHVAAEDKAQNPARYRCLSLAPRPAKAITMIIPMVVEVVGKPAWW